VSLPLFDNFQREQRVEQAQASRNEAQYRIRAQELQLTADVTGAYLTLVAQAKTVALQEQNAAKAKEELRLAQERYRVGAATFLDLSDARASYARAESERITAAYEYHKAFAALESAVGRPLR
jgi:outer membrane protein